MRTPLLITAALLASATISSAQPITQPTTREAAENDAKPARSYDRRFSVTPAPAEGPGTLDPFAFTFTLGEQTRGDAASQYLMAFSLDQPRDHQTPEGERYVNENNALQEMTPATLDADMAKRVLSSADDRLDLIEVAARREDCEWGFAWREQGFLALLPSLNEARRTAYLLSFRMKLNASRGQWQAWADDVRLILEMGDDVGAHDEPVLVEGLVGIGIQALALAQVEQAHEVEGMPNTYWPLATLPIDFDFGRMLQVERQSVLATFPELADPDDFTASDWTVMQQRLIGLDSPTGEYNANAAERLADAAKATMAGMMLEPAARGYLVDNGHFTNEHVAELGPWPVIAHYMVKSYDDAWNDAAKHAALPPVEALAGLDAMEQRVAADSLGGTLVAVVMPTLSRAYETPVRLERNRRALMIVEALRHHASQTGALPTSLDDVGLYIPADPFTGNAFGYRLDGDTAILTAAAYRDDEPERTGFDWFIDLRDE